jgi:hypothetical protein
VSLGQVIHDPGVVSTFGLSEPRDRLLIPRYLERARGPQGLGEVFDLGRPGD